MPQKLLKALKILKEEFLLLCDVEDSDEADCYIKAVRYIEKRYEDEHSAIDELCEFLGVRRTRIDRIFFEKLDITVKEYLDMMRVEKVKRMLGEGYAAKDCFKKCGFASEDTMRRVFKSVMKTTPACYLR